jgi:hypothetical protein
MNLIKMIQVQCAIKVSIQHKEEIWFSSNRHAIIKLKAIKETISIHYLIKNLPWQQQTFQ